MLHVLNRLRCDTNTADLQAPFLTDAGLKSEINGLLSCLLEPAYIRTEQGDDRSAPHISAR